MTLKYRKVRGGMRPLWALYDGKRIVATEPRIDLIRKAFWRALNANKHQATNNHL